MESIKCPVCLGAGFQFLPCACSANCPNMHKEECNECEGFGEIEEES